MEATSASSKSTSTGGEKDENKTSTSSSTEKKQSTRNDTDRLKAVVSVDVKTYSEARNALMTVYNALVTVLDCVEKNYEKLEKPKGSSGGRNYDGMY